MNGIIERVERYLDLVNALPIEAQVGLGLGTALALWMGWKVRIVFENARTRIEAVEAEIRRQREALDGVMGFVDSARRVSKGLDVELSKARSEIDEQREALQQLRDEVQVERNMRTSTAPALTSPEAKRAVAEAVGIMNAMEGARDREAPCTPTQSEWYEKRIAVLEEYVREGNDTLRRVRAQRDDLHKRVTAEVIEAELRNINAIQLAELVERMGVCKAGATLRESLMGWLRGLREGSSADAYAAVCNAFDRATREPKTASSKPYACGGYVAPLARDPALLPRFPSQPGEPGYEA